MGKNEIAMMSDCWERDEESCWGITDGKCMLGKNAVDGMMRSCVVEEKMWFVPWRYYDTNLVGPYSD